MRAGLPARAGGHRHRPAGGGRCRPRRPERLAPPRAPGHARRASPPHRPRLGQRHAGQRAGGRRPGLAAAGRPDRHRRHGAAPGDGVGRRCLRQAGRCPSGTGGCLRAGHATCQRPAARSAHRHPAPGRPRSTRYSARSSTGATASTASSGAAASPASTSPPTSPCSAQSRSRSSTPICVAAGRRPGLPGPLQRRGPGGRRASTTPTSSAVYDYGEARGTAYLVMPYVEGGTLHDRLRARGPLSLGRGRALPAAGGRRARLRPPARPRPPRHQAAEHAPARGGRPPAPGRLRHRQGAQRARSAHSRTGVDRHGRLHGPRAVPGQRRPRHRRLRARLRPLPAADRRSCPTTAPTEQVMYGHLLAPIPSIAERSRARAGGNASGHRAGAGEAPGGALRAARARCCAPSRPPGPPGRDRPTRAPCRVGSTNRPRPSRQPRWPAMPPPPTPPPRRPGWLPRPSPRRSTGPGYRNLPRYQARHQRVHR